MKPFKRFLAEADAKVIGSRAFAEVFIELAMTGDADRLSLIVAKGVRNANVRLAAAGRELVVTVRDTSAKKAKQMVMKALKAKGVDIQESAITVREAINSAFSFKDEDDSRAFAKNLSDFTKSRDIVHRRVQGQFEVAAMFPNQKAATDARKMAQDGGGKFSRSVK